MGLVAVDGARAGEGLGSVLGAEEGQMGEGEGVVEKVGIEKREARRGEPSREGLRKRDIKRSDTDSADKTKPNLVQIRHLDVDIPVRRAGVATELLVVALDHAFDIARLTPGSKNVSDPAEKVVVLTNPLSPGGERLLKKCAFRLVAESQAAGWPRPEKVGLFGWKGRWLELSRTQWKVRREVLLATARK